MLVAGKTFLNTSKRTLGIKDLSPIALSLAIASHSHRFGLLTCRGNNILFGYLLTETSTSTIYRTNFGDSPDPLAGKYGSILILAILHFS
jgi:hypothetical protein